MIRVEHVSMKFNLGIEKNYSMKEAFIAMFDKKRRQKPTEFWALDDLTFNVKKMSYFKATYKKKNKMSELISFKDVKKIYVVGEKKFKH